MNWVILDQNGYFIRVCNEGEPGAVAVELPAIFPEGCKLKYNGEKIIIENDNFLHPSKPLIMNYGQFLGHCMGVLGVDRVVEIQATGPGSLALEVAKGRDFIERDHPDTTMMLGLLVSKGVLTSGEPELILSNWPLV